MTISSSRNEDEVELVEDPVDSCAVNSTSFVDEQEWSLHVVSARALRVDRKSRDLKQTVNMRVTENHFLTSSFSRAVLSAKSNGAEQTLYKRASSVCPSNQSTYRGWGKLNALLNESVVTTSSLGHVFIRLALPSSVICDFYLTPESEVKVQWRGHAHTSFHQWHLRQDSCI